MVEPRLSRLNGDVSYRGPGPLLPMTAIWQFDHTVVGQLKLRPKRADTSKRREESRLQNPLVCFRLQAWSVSSLGLTLSVSTLHRVHEVHDITIYLKFQEVN